MVYYVPFTFDKLLYFNTIKSIFLQIQEYRSYWWHRRRQRPICDNGNDIQGKELVYITNKFVVLTFVCFLWEKKNLTKIKIRLKIKFMCKLYISTKIKYANYFVVAIVGVAGFFFGSKITRRHNIFFLLTCVF